MFGCRYPIITIGGPGLLCSASLLSVSMGKNRTINNIIFVIKSDHFHGSGPSRAFQLQELPPTRIST